MFGFVDEAGNTGDNVFDDAQPDFVTAALLTRVDFDAVYGRQMAALAATIGETGLHARELGLARLEGVADGLLRILKGADGRFSISRVEKRYLVLTKTVDHIFDSGENLAVPWHAYNARFMRMLLVFKIGHLIDEPLAAAFWAALMAPKPGDALRLFVDACRVLRSRVGHLPDGRSRELVGQALDWAIANPGAINIHSQGKLSRYGHLPNVVGFINLLDGVEAQSTAWDRSVRRITHDRQVQFERSLEFWHNLLSNASDEPLHLPGGETRVLQKVFGSELVIASSQTSAGIQVVDVVLWLYRRALEGKPLGPRTGRLMTYVFKRSRQHDFSYEGASRHTARLEAKLPRLEDIDVAQAREALTTLELSRLGNMAGYAAEKAAINVSALPRLANPPAPDGAALDPAKVEDASDLTA